MYADNGRVGFLSPGTSVASAFAAFVAFAFAANDRTPVAETGRIALWQYAGSVATVPKGLLPQATLDAIALASISGRIVERSGYCSGNGRIAVRLRGYVDG